MIHSFYAISRVYVDEVRGKLCRRNDMLSDTNLANAGLLLETAYFKENSSQIKYCVKT